MSNQRDEILARLSKAASLSEQAALVTELDEFDRHARHQAAVDREVDLADTVIRQTLTPVRTHEMHTASTDWLGDFEPEDPGQQHHAVIAEAALWFERTSPEVRADAEEFGAQAEGFMRRQASQYGDRMPAVYQAGLDYLGFLWRREAASGLDQVQQTVNPHEDPAPTPLPPQVFDNFAPDVHPINAGAVGTESSERNPLLQEIEAEGNGQGSPEVPGGHTTTNAGGSGGAADNSSGPLGYADPRQAQAAWDNRSVAINHTLSLDDFLKAEAASSLDQIQQTVNPHEDPAPTPLPTQVAFPWLISPDAYGNEDDEDEKDVAAKVASRPNIDDYEDSDDYYRDLDAYKAENGPEDHELGYPGSGWGHFDREKHKQGSQNRDDGRDWTLSPGQTRKQADMFGNSDTPHPVPGPSPATSPESVPNENASYADGQRDALAGDHPTFSDASSAAPANVQQYSRGYSDAIKDDGKSSPARDSSDFIGAGGASDGGSMSAAASRISDRFVKSAARENADFVKGYGFASTWAPGKPLVTLGSAEFESGIYAGIVDNAGNREAWRAAHQRQARKNPVFDQRMTVHRAYTEHLASQGISLVAGTSTDLDTLAPGSSPLPTGETPINGPGTVPPLAGGMDPAAPGGPAPYNGAEPYGAPAVPTGTPAPQSAGAGYVNDLPGGPLDGNTKALAFRRQVQASLLRQKKG